MGRRKNKDGEMLELVIKLGGLAIILSILNPTVRNFLTTLGSIAILLLILAIVVLFVVFVFKFIRRSKSKNDPIPPRQENYDPARNSPIAVFPPCDLPPIEHSAHGNIIEKLRAIDWFQFEKLVALAYEKQGYHVTRRGGANPDGGIDLVIEKDGQQLAVQCKQWKSWNVGVKAVREFLGALTDAKIQHGIFITLNGYTGDAKLLAEKHGIEIINETGLTAMLEILNIHEDPRVLEILNDTRKFCPKCERLMIERVAGKGLNPGQRFWGCTGYPKCRFTMPKTVGSSPTLAITK